MKILLKTAAAIALTAGAANAATSFVISTAPNNNVISTNGFAMNFGSSGLTITPDTEPLTPVVDLNSYTIVAGGSGGDYDGGSRYLSVFTGSSFSEGNYLGTSVQELDLSAAGEQTYTFSGISLASDATNFFFFSTWVDENVDSTVQFSELTQAIGRMRMLTGNPQDLNYTLNADGTVQNQNWDPAGSFTVTAVPEPSSAALLGLGGLALILRRRK